MTSTYVALRRIVALSVVITLVASSIASAQSVGTSPAVITPSTPALIGNAAFARLAHVARPDIAPSATTNGPRDGLLRAAEAKAREMSALTAPPRRTNSHKTNMIALGVVLGIVGFFVVWVSLEAAWGD